jgi:hypothetical protein
VAVALCARLSTADVINPTATARAKQIDIYLGLRLFTENPFVFIRRFQPYSTNHIV